jgi:sigma-B regulation protein RsbU (phosphoserine phosphatase)
MSAPAPVPIPEVSHRSWRRGPARVGAFWQRFSDGNRVSVLWGQFISDARASYGFYGADLDWEELNRLSYLRRSFRIAKHLFWALVAKLSPARRVLLLAAVALFFWAGLNVHVEWMSVALLLLLVSLELADKVIMKRDLEIAREIQTWLVPSQPPEIPGGDIAFATRPQNSVAGDYYDAFYPRAVPAAGGKLMLVIADVVGKSVPAALLMATLQASLRTIAGDDAPLVELVCRLNRYASAHSLDGLRFTTAVVGEYDPGSRRLEYVNAGHNPPILRRAGGALEKLEVGGLPLGISSGAEYNTAAVDLSPGDVLVFYTDGVVEAFNQAGQEYGNDRWFAAIRGLPIGTAQEQLLYLTKGVDDFVGATRQSDDITYMIFRCI